MLALTLAVLPAQASSQTLDSLIVELTEPSSVTGSDDALAARLLALLPGSSLDSARNVVWSRGTGDPVRVALCPMAEAAYVVGEVTSAGYLKLHRKDRWRRESHDRRLEGERVTLFGSKGPVAGVVGTRSLHLRPSGRVAAEEPLNLEEAYVDIGASSAEEVEDLGIAVLSPVTRAERVHRYGADLMAAPHASARAACAALLWAARREPARAGAGTAVVAFTRADLGAAGWAASVLEKYVADTRPSDVVVLGGAAGGDSLGTGVLMTRSDSMVVENSGRTSAWILPTRYVGTPVETISIRDVEALADHVARFLDGG